MTTKTFPRNPYVIGVPLTGDVGFFGRRETFTFVADTLDAEHQNVIVLYGQRRVGKTSLLHQLAKRLTQNAHPVYFDLQGKEQHSLGQVLYILARTIARPLDISAPDRNNFDDSGRFFHETFLPVVYEKLEYRRLLLLFDEFDVLGDELTSPDAASETLFPYLQSLIMHEQQTAFIFVVGRRIEELATHFQAIFKQAVYRRVGLLKPADARMLIVEPVKAVMTFEPAAVNAIIQLTAGHPYFTQLICSEAFNAMKAKAQHQVTEAEILSLIDQAIESGHGALTWFWDGLPRAERFIMSAVAHVTDGATGLASKEDIRQILEKHRIILTGLELTDAPDRLVEWEMLRREGPDHYRFVVELVRRWIVKAHSLENARRDVDFISRRAVRLYENARDAHIADELEYAREEYRRALDANPNHSGAQLGLAQVLFELGLIDESIEAFTKAYALDDMSARDGLVRAYQAQGKQLEESGQLDEAVLRYEQALDFSPADEVTRHRLASIWLGRGEQALVDNGLAAAVDPFQKALQFDRSETVTQQVKTKLEQYAKQFAEAGDFEAALKAGGHLRTLLPAEKGVLNFEIALWTRYGDTLAKDGARAEAINAYQRALELSPGNVTLTKKLEAISAEWEKLLQADGIFNKALVAHQDQDWETAKTGWQELIKLDVFSYKERNVATLLSEAVEALAARSRSEKLFQQGMAAHQSKDWPAAEAAWEKLISHGLPVFDGRQIRPLLTEARQKQQREVKSGRVGYGGQKYGTERSPKQGRGRSDSTIPSVTLPAKQPPDPAKSMWWPLILITIGWLVSGYFVALTVGNSNDPGGYVFGFAISGAIGGFLTGRGLGQYRPHLGSDMVFIVAVSWTIGLGLIGFVEETPVAGPIGALIGPLGTGLALRWAEPLVTWMKVLVIAFGWIIGWVISFVIVTAMVDESIIAYTFFGAIGGVIASSIMLSQLSQLDRRG